LQLSQALSKCFTTCRQYENEFNSERDWLHAMQSFDIAWSRDWIKISFMYENRCEFICVENIRFRTNSTSCFDRLKIIRVCELWAIDFNCCCATMRIECCWWRFVISAFITTL
jgi:hypothetical protein